MSSYPFYQDTLAAHQNNVFDMVLYKNMSPHSKLFISVVLNKGLIKLETLRRNRGPFRSEHFVMGSVNTEREIQLGCTQCSFADSMKIKSRCNKICARGLLKVSSGSSVMTERSTCD